MPCPRLALLLLLLLLLVTPPALAGPAAPRPGAGDDAEAFFERKVRPVLAGTCFRCHGGERVGGKLRVDSRAALIAGGGSGPALVPGSPDESLLIQAIRRQDDASPMPPDKPLAPEAVADLVAWVRGGATWPAASPSAPGFVHRRHWAFDPPRAAAPPPASASASAPDTGADTDTDSPTNPIDRFVAARLHERGITPVGPADRRTLIRRATFDLTGLPPSPEEVDAFLADESPDAFARVLDRLLASPHYGERWGRHWLDVVRYADTAGETADYPVPQARRYRDYVIAAFNRDMPYDQFLREQVAGDILARRADPTASPARLDEQVVATGYLAIARRFGFDSSKDQYLTIEDTIDVLGKSVLGLTIACARCHDHKYEPISQADYYGLYGTFASTRYPSPGCEKEKRPRDLVPLGSAGGRAGAGPSPASAVADPGAVELAYAVAEGTPRDARIHRRGDPEDLGEEVPRHFPAALGGPTVPPDSGSGRLALADWLTRPGNPLTARVMVNRIWQHHFGAGLVKTPNDFGTRGVPPTHPELLDGLALEFIARGWSVKAMHRLIMLSAAYRRSSAGDGDGDGDGDSSAARDDPDNTWLWRYPRRRLGAEEIRDAILAVSGDLDLSTPGPHPFPPVATWGFTQHAPFSASYDHDRRSVYLMTQRNQRHRFLALFDGADPNGSTATRHATTVATQALYFMNDPFVHAKSARFAARLAALGDDRARLDRACRLVFGRAATEEEARALARFLDAYEADLPPGDPSARRQGAWAAWLRVLLASNEFLYVD